MFVLAYYESEFTSIVDRIRTRQQLNVLTLQDDLETSIRYLYRKSEQIQFLDRSARPHLCRTRYNAVEGRLYPLGLVSQTCIVLDILQR